jgi:hypothetical protein
MGIETLDIKEKGLVLIVIFFNPPSGGGKYLRGLIFRFMPAMLMASKIIRK